MTFYLMMVFVSLAGQPAAIYEFSGPWTLQTCAAKVQEVTQRASQQYPNGQVTAQCVAFMKG
jgi:hypothetical protein